MPVLRRIGGLLCIIGSAMVYAGVSYAQGSTAPLIVPPAPQGAPSIMAAPTPSVRGQSLPTGPLISELFVEGTRRIDPSTVVSYMTVKEGDHYTACLLYTSPSPRD